MSQSDCIDHGYSTGTKGYAQAKVAGRFVYRHRLAYAEHAGVAEADLPPLLHSCDNRRCINPHHLKPGSLGENNTDRHLKGRDAVGEQHGQAKLDVATVRWIQAAYIPRDPEFSGRAIARKLGVSKATVQAVITGRYWRSVTWL